MAAAVGLTVLGLVLPWSRADEVVAGALSGHRVLAVVALGTAVLTALSATAVVATVGERRFTAAGALRGVTSVGGVLTVLGALVAIGRTHADRQWPGPVRLLAGPQDGLPASDETSELTVVGSTVLLTVGSTVYRIDVS